MPPYTAVVLPVRERRYWEGCGIGKDAVLGGRLYNTYHLTLVSKLHFQSPFHFSLICPACVQDICEDKLPDTILSLSTTICLSSSV